MKKGKIGCGLLAKGGGQAMSWERVQTDFLIRSKLSLKIN